MKDAKPMCNALLRSTAIIPCLMVVACLGQASKRSAILSSPVDQTTAVSFFWFGDMWSHWRQPMNLYVADAGDPRLHTLHNDMHHSKGWDTWITTSEMRDLVEKLARSDLKWDDSGRVEPFKNWIDRKSDDMFDITVVSSKGTAKTGIRIARMCDELQQFDSVMATPRILWQFQTMRWDDGCVIPGYHNEIVPKD